MNIQSHSKQQFIYQQLINIRSQWKSLNQLQAVALSQVLILSDADRETWIQQTELRRRVVWEFNEDEDLSLTSLT